MAATAAKPIMMTNTKLTIRTAHIPRGPEDNLTMLGMSLASTGSVR